jgi:hypothetical protein
MRRIRRIVIISFLFTGAAAALYPQTETLSAHDLRAAEDWYRWAAYSDSLHASNEKFPDGSRGTTVNMSSLGVFAPLGVFKTRGEREHHDTYCHSAAIVVGRELSAQGILSGKKDLIFTLYQFQVMDVVKSTPDTNIGKQIEVLRLGGEVSDAGEILQMKVHNEIPIDAGQTYLLVLLQNEQNPTSFFFTGNLRTIPVKNGRIYPALGTWGAFTSGARLDTIQSRTKEILEQEPCK